MWLGLFFQPLRLGPVLQKVKSTEPFCAGQDLLVASNSAQLQYAWIHSPPIFTGFFALSEKCG